MPSHKQTNEFIKNWNKYFAIKGYSKLNIAEKNKLVESKVKALVKQSSIGEYLKIQDEWRKLNGKSALLTKSSTPAPKKAPPKPIKTDRAKPSRLEKKDRPAVIDLRTKPKRVGQMKDKQLFQTAMGIMTQTAKENDKYILVSKSEYKESDITPSRETLRTSDKELKSRLSKFKRENKPIVVFKERVKGHSLMKDHDIHYITSKNAWENRSGKPKPSKRVDYKEEYGVK
tara:strand:- start:3200 stop:3886 length:687 start_codon:yes stop_codon:yes gene_type:complete